MDAVAKNERNPAVVSTVNINRFSLGVENEQADAGRDRPNLSRETKFSGANGDEEIKSFRSAHHEQDWQPYPVDPYPASTMTIHTVHNRKQNNARGCT